MHAASFRVGAAAAGIVFLDPAFATEILKPLVDHRLSKASAKKDVMTFVRATQGAEAGADTVARLLNAVNDHVTKGILSEALLPF